MHQSLIRFLIVFVKLAWENLEVARILAEKKYESIKSSENCSKEEIEPVLKFLSRVTLRLGDLECHRDNFEEGLKGYMKALEIRQIFDDPSISRDLSELYIFLLEILIYYISKTLSNWKYLSLYWER